MAKIIHLDAGIAPPAEETCLIVVRDLTGGYYVADPAAGYQKHADPLAQPVSEAERDAAIARASAWSDQHGIGAVYVVS
jgi:hypothetical protein